MGRFKGCVSVIISLIISLYLTLLLEQYHVFNTLSQGMLIFVYWMVIALVLIKWLQKEKKHLKSRKGMYLFSSVLSILILAFSWQLIYLHFETDTSVEIIATGQKNADSEATEVWLTDIEIDGVMLDVSTVSLTEGWYYKDALVSYPADTPHVLSLQLQAAESIKLSFIKHPWSGKVHIKTSGNYYEIDLYDAEGSVYVCEIPIVLYQPWFLNVFSVVAAFAVIFLLGEAVYFIFKRMGAVSFVYRNFIWYKEKSTISKVLIWVASAIVCFQLLGAEGFIIKSNYGLLQWMRFGVAVICTAPLMILIFRCFEVIEQYLTQLGKGREQKVSRNVGRTKLIVLILSFILSIPILLSIREIFFVTYSDCMISILPTGEKNEDAFGTEVLLSGVTLNGSPYNPESFEQLPNGWKNENGMLFGIGTTPLTISVPESGNICIYFNKHQWSGIVEIQDGERTERYDLYANSESPSYIMSYQVTGNRIYKNDLGSIVLMLLLELAIIGLFYNILKGLHRIWMENGTSKNFLWYVLLCELCIYGFYILASYPASICVDGRTQLYQALGYEPLTDAHPAFHTMLVRLFTLKGSFLVGIPIMQAVCISLLSAVILNYLYKSGVNRKALIIFGICSALFINNGIYVTTIWKDVTYSYCLLWLTYLLFRMEKEKLYIKNVWNITAIAVALSLVHLLRHNGIVVVIGISIILIVWTFLKRELRYLLTVLLSILLILGMKKIVYPMIFHVQGIDVVDVGYASVLHGIVYAGISGEIPEETESLLVDIMPMEEWKKCYSRYSANEMTMSAIAMQHDARNKISEIGTGRIIKEYVRTFFHSPARIIEDRLFGIDILWNVMRDEGYDWRVANDTYEVGIVNNYNEWYRRDNILTNVVKKAFGWSTENKVIDAIFWRAGIWISFLLVIMCYGYIKKKDKWIYYLPTILNALSLCIAMAWQDFRYVYFVNLCVPYLTLMCISAPSRGKANYSIEEENI